MKLKLAVLIGLTLLTTIASGRESFNEHLTTPPEVGPWFTGPILTPSGHVVPTGHQNYEPYLYWTQITGSYGSNWHTSSVPTFNNVLLQGSMQFGIFPETEFDIAPQFVYNQTQGQRMVRVSDFPLVLAFQLLEEKQDTWMPAVKLRFAASVPLGKWDRLSPARLGTDVGGVGTWYPSVGLVLGKLFHIKDTHYLASRLFLGYSFGTPADVRGLSIYGGAPPSTMSDGTKGRVYPGNVFLLLNGYEFSLTQNWALAFDFQYQHTDRTRFTGFSPDPRPSAPSRELFAIAPAIEYNWSANVGLIAGPWLTVAGRNSSRFISYVVALNIYK